MITEKTIYTFKHTRFTDSGVLYIPDDIPIEDLIKISMSGGVLLWFVGGIYYLVPSPKLDNVVSLFEDTERIDGCLVEPPHIRWDLEHMYKLGPVIIPLV